MDGPMQHEARAGDTERGLLYRWSVGGAHALAPKVVIRRLNRVISAAGAAEALLLAEPKSEGKSKKGCCSKAFDLTSLPRYEK